MRQPTRVHPDSEITRDPIFLFQRARYIYTDRSNGRYEWDSEVESLVDAETNEMIGDETAVRLDLAIKVWETEHVFFTREEGEQWGRGHAYNYPDGWMVYCVCAKGTLAKLLLLVTTRPDPTAAAPAPSGRSWPG